MCDSYLHKEQIAQASLCLTLCLGFGASFGGEAQADSWIESEGWVSLGVTDGLDQSSKSEGFFFGGNGTWSTSGDGLGLSFGAFGTIGRLHETYAAATWTSAQDARYAVGNPRPAYDLFAQPVLADVFLSAALERSDVGLSRATDGALTETEFLPIGGSYMRDGAALSLHYVDEYNTYILGIAERLDLSEMSLDAALELVDGDTTEANAKLQLNRDLGPGIATASLFYGGANDTGTEMELAYRHPVGGRVTLSEIISVPLSDSDDTLVALGAQVDLGGAWSLNTAASYADDDSAFMAGVRIAF